MIFKRIIPLILTVFLLLPAHPSHAADAAATSVVTDAVCDPQVFARMRQKGWAEAQRENYTNQSLILKPDNIFAATCYDKQLGVTKTLCVPVNGETASPSACEKAINSSSVNVLNGLIGPLGPDGKPLETPNPSSTTSQTYTGYDKTAASSASFNCDEMNKLWQQQECGNFSGGLLTSLKEVGDSAKDSRGYPQACTAGKDDPLGADQGYNYSTTLGNIYAPGAKVDGFNPLDTHSCDTMPYSQLGANGNTCPKQCKSNPTGRKTPEGKDEVSCSNPGCHAEPDGSAMKCVPNQ